MGPSDLPTDDARIREIAVILAAGMLRLRARAALPGDPHVVPQIPRDSPPNGLEVPDETSLSVHTG
jgi:hypothetical protein